ncbi:hypothetical protein ACEQPO_00875 [Bacillus sp. SL00103]
MMKRYHTHSSLVCYLLDLRPARQTMPNKISKTIQPKNKETTQADQKKRQKQMEEMQKEIRRTKNR